MGENNSENAFILIGVTTLEDFFIACGQRRYSSDPFYDKDGYGDKADVPEYFDIEKHETAFQYWRTEQGFSQKQMAQHIGFSVGDYTDIEEGEKQASVEFIIRFCNFMDLHPADLIVKSQGALNPDYLDILLKCYEAYQTRNIEGDLDIINELKINDVISALAEEGDAQWSYDYLKVEKKDCKDVVANMTGEYSILNKNSFGALSRFIEKLMVNDGNLNIRPSDLIDLEQSKIQRMFNHTQKKHQKSTETMLVVQEQMNELGEHIFGEQWSNHRKVLDGVYEQFSHDEFCEFFTHDLPWPKDTASLTREMTLLGLYKSQRESSKKNTEIAHDFLEIQEISSAFDSFLESFSETIKIYENRQMIFGRAPDLINDCHGKPDHLEYVHPVFSPLLKKPIALLPKP